jgi:hypothetical protein
MSYLHCHGKNCNWSQDDFWDWKIKWKDIFNWQSRPFGYNPLSIILEDVAMYIRPRWIEFDSTFIIDSGIKPRHLNSQEIFSWSLLRWELSRQLKSLFAMKYWTYEQFEKAKNAGKYKCPKCGSDEWDID